MVTYPKDWGESELGILFDVSAGGDVDRSYFSKNKTIKHPYEIFSNGIDNRGLYGYTSKPLHEGDSITVTARGTIGKAFYRSDPYDAIIRLLVLAPKSNDVSSMFYTYFINNNIVFEDEHTGVPQLTAPKIKRINMPKPSLPEQKAIAATLSCIDTHIANLTELIEKKKAIRDGALEDLVRGKTRLEGFSEEWDKTTIGGILTILHGRNQKDVESFDGKYPILGTGGFIGKATEYLCDWECVLIGRKGTIDKPMYMNTPFWTIDTLYYSRPKANQCVKFQYYLFCTIDWYAYTESSGRPSLAKKVIEGIEVKIPKFEEQKAIVEVLSSLDTEIVSLEEEKYKMLQIKAGAMDDLLTGRVRLMRQGG